MLSVAAPATSAEKYLYVLADALDIFFPTPLSLPLLFSKQLLYGLAKILTFCLFYALSPLCHGSFSCGFGVFL